MTTNPETGLTDVQKAYNVAQSDVFQLAAYGHHRYHPSGEALTEEGKRQQRDYNDRIRDARERLEAGLLRLVAEHAETFAGRRMVSVDWLRALADDPGELSLLAVRPDEREEARDGAPAVVPVSCAAPDQTAPREQVAEALVPFFVNFSDEEAARVNAGEAAAAVTAVLPTGDRATEERDRYRTAWRSARERAQAFGEGILLHVAQRDFWMKAAEQNYRLYDEARATVLREAADRFDQHAEKLLDGVGDKAVFVAKALRDQAAVWSEAAETLRRLAAEATPEPATHSCRNCDGIDPDTCFTNPNRPPEQCSESEFDGYGRQCEKPAGHNLCTFEEEPTAVVEPQPDDTQDEVTS